MIIIYKGFKTFMNINKIIVPYNRINKIFCNICRFRMKKVYDWDLGLTIKVENNNKIINIVCSVHTTVHQLKI